MREYNHKAIEEKRRKEWARKKIYSAKENTKQPKCYVLDMFPYPSGEGLHVGHPKGYIATDIYSRFKRMNGFNVLHPMGWDAFGLPAENYAIKNKTHPRKTVEKNIERFKKQLSIIGLDYDWNREVNTTDPGYYKWTQWIFLKLLEKGLAYESFEPINWCPSCQTGLANEDLEDGKCERCGSIVEKKPMRQWMLRITDYADRLLSGLHGLNWPESIKESQRNWIGKSEGAEIDFEIKKTGTETEKNGSHKSHKKDSAERITIFTTRADTLFGVTYLVLSPEHPFIQKNRADILNFDEVSDYVKKTKNETEIERTSENKKKTGVELKGLKAINPANREEIPIWLADYVLASYGTGAVMAVPAHDERDFEFAKEFGLPVKQVVAPFFIDKDNPPKDGKKWTPRRNVIVMVKHPTEDKIIQLQWKNFPWKTLVIGGVEDNETYEKAAKREVREETGYKNFKSVEKLGWLMESHFYALHKDVNRQAFPQVFCIKLSDLEKENISDEETSIHNVVWVPSSEIKTTFGPCAELPEIVSHFEQGAHAFVGNGKIINSGKFDGLDSEKAKTAIVTYVGGRMVAKYKLRDWVFSRQRYWGEPIPVVHCEKCGIVPVPEKDLPVKLPNVKNYAPAGTGESPLAAIDKWVNVKCPKCRGNAKRETNTMPQWAGSCWYYLRFMDPKNGSQPFSPEKEKYWAPVDVYVGGAEHAARHLIYARFWHKFLNDINLASTPEPFIRFHSVGLIMGEDGQKMSKRFGNVVNPDKVVETYGADTFRIYEMFIGPFEQSSSWDMKSIMGSRRLIERIWRIGQRVTGAKSAVEGRESGDTQNNPDAFERILHTTIAKVTADIESFNFNTAISGLMILSREFENLPAVRKEDYSILLKLLAPFAPHITDGLWLALDNKESIHLSQWPKFDPTKISSKTVTIIIQVNGKVRSRLEIETDSTENEVKDRALALQDVKKWLNKAKILKIIFVKNRLINFVTSAE